MDKSFCAATTVHILVHIIEKVGIIKKRKESADGEIVSIVVHEEKMKRG